MTEHKRDVYTWIASGLLISAPLAAAIPFGYGVFTEVNEYTGLFGLAVLSAFAIAATLEGVGMLGGHLAITLQRRNDGRWLLAGSTVLIYTAVGIGVLGLLLRQWVGAVAFGLVPVVYILVGLLLDARAVQTEQRETAHVQTERQWTLEDRREERQHQLEMKRLELEASTKLAVEQRVPAQPAQSGYECPQCHDTFGSQQAVNAHQRWCTAVTAGISANGSGK